MVTMVHGSVYAALYYAYKYWISIEVSWKANYTYLKTI